MAITFDVQPGYQFSASERVTYSKLNLLGTPGISLAGTVDSSEITDGAVTTQKLADSIDINSKVDDHNLALTNCHQGLMATSFGLRVQGQTLSGHLRLV